jgi:hypothetical protein
VIEPGIELEHRAIEALDMVAWIPCAIAKVALRAATTWGEARIPRWRLDRRSGASEFEVIAFRPVTKVTLLDVTNFALSSVESPSRRGSYRFSRKELTLAREVECLMYGLFREGNNV